MVHISQVTNNAYGQGTGTILDSSGFQTTLLIAKKKSYEQRAREPSPNTIAVQHQESDSISCVSTSSTVKWEE